MDVKRMTVTEFMVSELNKKGFQAKGTVDEKNDQLFDGIHILMEDGISCFVSLDNILEAMEKGATLDKIASSIIDFYKEKFKTSFYVAHLYDRNYVLEHLYIGLHKKGSRYTFTRSCELDGIESHLYIRALNDNEPETGIFHIRATRELFENLKIVEDEAWKSALMNINKDTQILHLPDAIIGHSNEVCIDSYDNILAQSALSSPMFIITNKDRFYGASAILNKDALSKLGRTLGIDKFFVLPSSIHEMILMPYSKNIDLDIISEMVLYINNNYLDRSASLADRAYVISI